MRAPLVLLVIWRWSHQPSRRSTPDTSTRPVRPLTVT